MRVLLIALLTSLCLPAPALTAGIHLSAAASMTDAVKDLATAFERKNPDTQVWSNFAASGALARQIERGAPADLFISANPHWTHDLVAAGHIPERHVRLLARNTLVFVGRPGQELATLAELESLARIAIGSPASVPAGQYAVQVLEAAGLYQLLQARLVLAKDVRQALLYADRGETDGAFVYRTDARLAREAVILLDVPAALHDPVTYTVGLTADGLRKPAAVAFYAFLDTAEAVAILEGYGFVVPLNARTKTS